MTLERFGFIGEAKACFWGMTGVNWTKPLRVWQLGPKNTTTATKKEETGGFSTGFTTGGHHTSHTVVHTTIEVVNGMKIG